MNEEITASYTLTESTFLPAFKWHHLPLRRSGKVVGGIAAAMCVVAVLAFMSSTPTLPLNPLVAVIPAMIVVLAVGIGWLSKRHYVSSIKKSTSYGKRIQFRINEEGVKVDASDSQTRHDWSAYSYSLLTPDGILLYLSNRTFQWLPKSSFTSQPDYSLFLDLIAAKTKLSKIG